MSDSDDDQHLRILSICHYVYAAMQALLGCIPLIYVGVGVFFLVNPPQMKGGDPPPELFGWMMVIVGAIGSLFAWTVALCTLLAGRSLAARRRYTFCIVMAAICCVFPPIGTVLGVFTLIVLLRPSVKLQFEQAALRETSQDEDLWANVDER